MANWDNAHTKQVQEETTNKHEAGIDDGARFIGYPLPAFCSKPVKDLIAYERGFLLGWWLKQWLGSVERTDREYGEETSNAE
jgi:hypothetical protein